MLGTACCSPVSTFTVHRAAVPERVDVNTTWRESGDQLGVLNKTLTDFEKTE